MNSSTPTSSGQSQTSHKKVGTSTGSKPQDFGRVDSDGNVWVKDGDAERMVGGYPDGVPEDPFALYVRRYLDLEATVNLFESRLPTLGSKDIDSTLTVLQEQLVEPAAVGDLQSLRDRVKNLRVAAESRKEEIHKERAAAKEESLVARTKVVDEAESIAAQNVDTTQWKQSGQRLRELLDQWKDLQRKGPRLDKQTEDTLWKKFSAARTTFDRNRRQFFAALDDSQAQAKATKERLISEAEELQKSEEWGPTSAAYRRLMDEWKRSGRASRKDDDALWARFRAAQQVFFDRRRAKDEAADAEYTANLEAKEALLLEAEAILPITDIAASKESLRLVQDKWEEIGHVPNRDVARIEGRLRSVEQAIRDAEEAEWQRSNPETQARAQGMLSQLEESISELENQLTAVNAAGDSKKASEIEDALSTKRAWLAQVSESFS